MQVIRILVAAIFLLSFSGCGGGSSSTGSGGSEVSAGSYAGSQTIEISVVGGVNLFPDATGMTNLQTPPVIPRVVGQRSQNVTATIDNGGIFTLFNAGGQPILQSGIFENAINFTGPASVLINSSCTGSVILQGSIRPGVVVGGFTGSNVFCDGISVAVSGNFEVNIQLN